MKNVQVERVGVKMTNENNVIGLAEKIAEGKKGWKIKRNRVRNCGITRTRAAARVL
jgi:hypothetical protein